MLGINSEFALLGLVTNIFTEFNPGNLLLFIIFIINILFLIFIIRERIKVINSLSLANSKIINFFRRIMSIPENYNPTLSKTNTAASLIGMLIGFYIGVMFAAAIFFISIYRVYP